MNYPQLGRTDLIVSSLGMGCVTFGREIDEPASFAVLDRAFERGITLYDTAEAYAAGTSERVLGKWVRERGVRDRIVLATKVSGPLTRKRIVTSAEESLARLRTDTIDLFQLHVWDDQVPLDETLEALGRLIEQGKARAVGCSNWSAWQVAKALLATAIEGAPRMESVQPAYNLVQREIEPDLVPLCIDQAIGILSYSPLGAGFLTGKYRRGGEVPKGTRFDVIPDHQPIYFTDDGFRVLEGLRTLAEETGEPMVRLALAWVVRRAGITSVLIGGRSPAHVDQALDAQEWVMPEEIARNLDFL